MGFAVGMTVVNVWGMFDNGKWMWKLALVFQIIPSLFITIVTFTIFSEFDSPVQLIKKNKKKLAIKILSSYMKDEIVKFNILSFEESIRKEE